MPNIARQTTTATTPRILPRSASRFWSGVSSCFCPASIAAIRPISVSMPVAVTTPSPRP